MGPGVSNTEQVLETFSLNSRGTHSASPSGFQGKVPVPDEQPKAQQPPFAYYPFGAISGGSESLDLNIFPAGQDPDLEKSPGTHTHPKPASELNHRASPGLEWGGPP